MSATEIVSLAGSIVAVIAVVFGMWYQARTLKRKEKELHHKIEYDLKVFQETYASPENLTTLWLDGINNPKEVHEDSLLEIGYPYLAGAPVRRPEMFYGRRDLLEDCIKCGNGDQMASLSILGARRAGKTSFLRFLEYSLGADRYPQIVPVYLDAQTPIKSCENFYAYMLREAMQALEKRNINIPRAPDLPKEVPYDTLSTFFKQAGDRHWRFLLLLDEMESLVKFSNIFDEKFFSGMRALIQIGQVSWITSSFRTVYMPNTTSSPFLNIIQATHYIGPLTEQDARRLVVEPAARAGHFFEKEDIQSILKIAGRMPFLIQKAALMLYMSHINNVRGEEARRQLASSFALEMQNYLQSQLKHLTKEEYDTLVQVVRQGEIDKDSQPLLILQNYGFIEKVDERYQILGETFADYLYRYSKTVH
jgi:hypothetical protein